MGEGSAQQGLGGDSGEGRGRTASACEWLTTVPDAQHAAVIPAPSASNGYRMFAATYWECPVSTPSEYPSENPLSTLECP